MSSDFIYRNKSKKDITEQKLDKYRYLFTTSIPFSGRGYTAIYIIDTGKTIALRYIDDQGEDLKVDSDRAIFDLSCFAYEHALSLIEEIEIPDERELTNRFRDIEIDDNN